MASSRRCRRTTTRDRVLRCGCDRQLLLAAQLILLWFSQLLGLPITCTAEDVKKAYRRLVRARVPNAGRLGEYKSDPSFEPPRRRLSECVAPSR